MNSHKKSNNFNQEYIQYLNIVDIASLLQEYNIVYGNAIGDNITLNIRYFYNKLISFIYNVNSLKLESFKFISSHVTQINISLLNSNTKLFCIKKIIFMCIY